MPADPADIPAFSTLIANGAMAAEETADIIAKCFEGVQAERRGIHTRSHNRRGRPLAGNLTSAPWVDILERLDGVIDIAHLAVSDNGRSGANRFKRETSHATVSPSALSAWHPIGPDGSGP